MLLLKGHEIILLDYTGLDRGIEGYVRSLKYGG